MRSEAIFDIASKRTRIAALEEKMASPGFWDDNAAAREVMAEPTVLKAWVEPFDALKARVNEMEELRALLDE
jgi:peptide chain release factor 2